VEKMFIKIDSVKIRKDRCAVPFYNFFVKQR